jgi:hypothetical protein
MASPAQFKGLDPQNLHVLPLIGQSWFPHSLHRSRRDTHSEHECQAERADRCNELEVQFEDTAPSHGQVLRCDAKLHCNKDSVIRVW